MSTEVVRELLQNIQSTLQMRMKVVEEILTATKQTAPSGDHPELDKRLNDLEGALESLNEYAMGQVRTLAYNHDMLEKRVELLESSMRNASEALLTINSTIGSLQKRMDDERPVEAAEVEAEIEETQEAALNADVDAAATEAQAKVALAKAVEQLEEEEEEADKADDEADDSESEEDEPELEAFDYKKKTYARDVNNNVYAMDDEGCADTSEVIGIWNPVTKKIDPVPEEEVQEEEPELEAFDYGKKTYARDQNNNVYVLDDEGCADTSQVYGIWNPKTKKIERVPNA
jgi:hypothetical protein